MWRSTDRDCGYLHKVICLCRERSGGFVLLSTRDLRIAEEVEDEKSIRFGMRSEEAAGVTLCKYARLRSDAVANSRKREIRDSYKNVLGRCGGLPVASAVAGKADARIGARMRKTSGDQLEAGSELVEYRDDLENQVRYRVNLVRNDHGDHAGLFTSLKMSLKAAERIEKRRNAVRDWALTELHQGLCVLQKQQWAPVTMLSCLWGVSKREAKSIAEMMEGISACDIEYRLVAGKSVFGVRVHDLIHEYCLTEASKKMAGVQMCYKRSVDGYWDRYVNDTRTNARTRRREENEETGCWSNEVVEDLYVQSRLFTGLSCRLIGRLRIVNERGFSVLRLTDFQTCSSLRCFRKRL